MKKPAQHDVSHSNFYFMLIVAAICLCTTAALFVYERDSAHQNLRDRFLGDASLRAVLVSRMIDDHRTALDMLGRFYDASHDVERKEFQTYTASLLKQRTGIYGFAWNPVVSDADRARFEQQARQDGLSDYQFREYDNQHRLIAAQSRAVYYPVYFAESRARQRALGLDIGSIPERKALLDKARDTGQTVATGSVSIVGLPPTDWGVIVFLPVYQKKGRTGSVGRTTDLQGFLSVVLLPSKVMAAAVEATPAIGLTTELIDLSAAPDRRMLNRWTPSAESSQRSSNGRFMPISAFIQNFTFADRQWQLRIEPTSDYLQIHATRAYLWIPPIGLMLTAMLTALLYILMAGRERAENLVHLRETMLQAISANIPGVVYQFYARPGREYGLYYVSPRSDDLFGISHTDPDFFNTFAHKLDESDRQAFLASVDQAVGKTAPWNFEGRFHRTPDETLWIKGQAVPERRGDEVVFNGVLYDITTLKQAEAALRESETRYRTLVESADDGIILFDLQMHYLYSNPAHISHLGYTPEEYYQVPALERVHPEDMERVKTRLMEMMKKGKASVEYRYQHKDGHWLDESVKGAMLYDAAGKPTGVMLIVRDVSEQKATERRLQQSEERYRGVVETQTELIARFLQDGTITFTNRAWQRYFALHLGFEDDIIGKKITDLMQIKNFPEVQAFLAPLIHGQNAAAMERNFTAQSGATRWLLWHIQNIGSEQGETGEYQIVGNDITEHKAAEEELRRLRNLLKNIIDSMPSLMVGIDTQGRITHWNREAAITTGIDSQQAVGRVLTDIMPQMGQDMEKITAAISNRSSFKREKVAALKDDQVCYSDITIYPLIANGVDGAVIRIDDITERVRIEELMIQSEKMLSVGGLAAGMAHEINNPLAGILQNIQVIRNRISLDLDKNSIVAQECGVDLTNLQNYLKRREIYPMIESVMESGRRAAKIVENMLSFSRKSESRKIPHNLEVLLDKSVELAESDYDLKKKYDFKRIRIEREYAADLPLVLCEPGQIQQVFLNILRNGAEAMAEIKDHTPQFILRVRAQGAFVTIEIEDNGPGMDPTIAKRVFEPFFTTKAVGAGTGLGLSVSYFIITENHGGSLAVHSAPGRGTTFIIRLPVGGPMA